MSQLLEQKTNNHELHIESSFDLSKVSIEHTSSVSPSFQFTELADKDDGEERRVGVAFTDSASGDEGQKSATAFLLNEKGALRWSVGDDIELIVVRDQDESATRLGSDGAENGIITDLHAQDEVYMVSKEFAAIIENVGSFDKKGFDTISSSPEIKADVVRVSFEQALPLSAESKRAAVKRRHEKNRIRDERQEQAFKAAFDVLPVKDVVTTKVIMEAMANDAELQQQIADALAIEPSKTATDKQTDDHATSSSKTASVATEHLPTAHLDSTPAGEPIGISEMVRLAQQVEKYTQKVASYEDLAAEALARRMKGRLFAAPRYKTQGEKAAAQKALEESGKENTLGTKLTRLKDAALDKIQAKSKKDAKLDDDYMHLLEGFSRALDGAMMKQWLAEGYSDDEAAQMLYEHQQTRQEARAARNREEFRKDKLGSFLDKYANMSKGKKIGVTIGAAAVFGTIGVVAGAAGGVAAAAGGIGLAGVKVGKTYLQHRSKIYQTGKDEPMTPPNRAKSVANGQAEKRTAAQQVFAGMEHDKKKREQAIEKSDRNKKVAVGLAAAAGILLGAGVVTKIAEHGDDIKNFFSKPLMPKVPTDIDGPSVGRVVEPPVVTQEPVLPPKPAEFSIDATTVTAGEGWYQTIQETTGVTDPARQAAILQKIGPVLQQKGWAYPMSDGTWGISRPGTLPKDVLELIKNTR